MNGLSIKWFKKPNAVKQEKLTLKLLLALLLLSSASLATAQTVKSYIDNEWPDSRYTDHGNGTVTDTKTGLMWKQCSEGQSGDTCADDGSTKAMNWKQALEHAESHAFAGYSDWRVPNIKELRSLVARNRYEPSINSTRFPNTSGEWFWSASPYAHDHDDALVVDFKYGYDGYYNRNGTTRVRLVRGGQ